MDHLFSVIKEEEKIDLDLREYGFSHFKLPWAPRDDKPAPVKLPYEYEFALHLMDLMESKLSILRKYFAAEAKDLIWYGVDKTRTKQEQAMLDKEADAGSLLAVSQCAQDCVRGLQYLEALFDKENSEIGKKAIQGDEGLKNERFLNERRRDFLLDLLREQIAEQLPGDKKTRKRFAKSVVRGAFNLEDENVYMYRQNDDNYDTEDNDDNQSSISSAENSRSDENVESTG